MSAPASPDHQPKSAAERTASAQPAAQPASDESAEGDDPMEAYMRMLAQQQQQQRHDERTLDTLTATHACHGAVPAVCANLSQHVRR